MDLKTLTSIAIVGPSHNLVSVEENLMLGMHNREVEDDPQVSQTYFP